MYGVSDSKQVWLALIVSLFSCFFSISLAKGFSLVKPVTSGNQYNINPAGSILSRPQMDTSIVTPSGLLRIHFDTSGVNVPAYDINEFALAGDSSLAAITGSFGFPLPPEDNGHGGDNLYDIYIAHIYNYCEIDFDSLLPSGAYSTFCIVNNDFGTGFYTHGINAAKISIAHSLAHAVTVGNYPFNEDNIWYYEIAATAMEEFIFDYVNDYYAYLYEYFYNPFKSFSQYSGFCQSIWNIYLRDRFGSSIIKRIWEFTVSNNIFDAMDDALIEMGSSLENEFGNFGIWCYYTNTRAIAGQYFEEADNYPLLNLNSVHDIVSPQTTVMLSAFPYSNNVILLHDNRPGFQADIVAVICNHDKDNAVINPNFNLAVEYNFLTYDDGNSVQISGDYWYNILSSANENILVLHLINDQLTSVKGNLPEPKYELYQNYPNPFNPSTNIKYRIRELNFVNLCVYDILGNQVKTLINEEQSAGVYEIIFNASGLSSGVYFVRLTAGDYRDTKKMFYIK